MTRASVPDARLVFLTPPSWEELVRRLVGRGTESEEERERLYEDVYQSDVWKNDIGPRVGELIDREQIKVTRIEATTKSVLR